MQGRVADRLIAARRRQFVGRLGELGLFRSALAAAEPPFYVLHVFGPGGVGKTSLLREFAALCKAAGIPVAQIDGRNVEASPEPFIQALGHSVGLGPGDSVLHSLGASSQRNVILIDTYDLLSPLDAWLRDVFLPQLPEYALVVIAGRDPPSPGWRSDPGWQTLIRSLPLRNLTPDESRGYLSQRAVPSDQHDAVLDFTRGHPLALSLVADLFAQRGNVRFHPETAPDVVKTLLEELVQKVPGPAHRAALESCALVRVMSEPLLAEMLSTPDAHELFEWLRGLSFMESGRLGLSLHDLTREALVADLRWRNPDLYRELHRRARKYYAARVQQTGGQEQERVLFDYTFLHRDNPVVRPFFDLLEGLGGEGLLSGPATESDVPALLALVERHEGAETASLAAQWFARGLQGVLVFRDAKREPAGFLAMLALHGATQEHIAADPATRAAWAYLQRDAPLRPGEVATHFRFWMARDTHQAVSSCQSLIFIDMVRHYLTTPGLAFTFIPCREPEFYAPVMAYGNIMRLPEADFEVGGQRYGVFGHDWRAEPPMAWLSLLAERETDASATQALPRQTEQVVVLSQPDFAAAVRDVLHHFCQPEALRANPLLRSRVILERTGLNAAASERVAALRSAIREAVDMLQASPRELKLYRALFHTYLQPASTQEQAAELLDLPFSTYRRHLTAGVIRVAEILWQRELHGAGT